jgi:hypothetical protein
MLMRMMLIVAAAVLLASPLSAQTADPAPTASDAWRAMPIPDPRLRAGFADASAGMDTAEWRSRLPLHTWALLGAAAGCITGALVLGATAREGEVAPLRFNGCILGGAVGGFLGGIVGLATGA